MSTIFFDLTPVIFNIASQFNPGKHQARKILSMRQ